MPQNETVLPLRSAPRRTPGPLRAALLAALLAAAALAAGCGASLPADPVVEISPASAQLQAGGGSQQFTATVLNDSNQAVVWKVNGVLGGGAASGTVTQTGLYRAPAAAPAGAVAVEALSVADPNSSASAAITLTPAVAVGLSPATASVLAGASQQFTAVVSNTTNTAVTWSVNGTVGGSAAVGTISSSGLYTAPASFPGLSQVTVVATSVADPDMSASAVVTLAQPVTVQVAPPTASVNLGASQTFTATVGGSANQTVTWSVNGVAGGSAASGLITPAGVFTAPAAVPAPAEETVTATSAADPTKSASAAVTIVAPITITLTPAAVTLGGGGTQQFSTVVTNTANTAVTWSVNGTVGGSAALGTITASGLYTAPLTFPGLNQVTVGVASVADPTRTASALVTLSQAVGVSVSPATVAVNVGATQSFVATVTNTPNGAVTWSVNGQAGGNPTLGTIDASGLYTAPASVPSPALETVTATSVADPTKSGTAQLTVTAPVGISLSPLTAMLGPGATQQFSATVTNAQNTAVTWSVNAAAGGNATVGTISANGLYTAPATFPGLATVTVKATSVQDPTRSASATVTLAQPVAVSLTPAAATINLGAGQQFAATVTGSANQAVTWAVNGIASGNAVLGTIDASGLYTAPAKLPAPAQETVTATSVADNTKSASAQITLQVPPAQFTLTPASATLSLGKAQSGSQAFQLTLSAGFANPVQFTVSGQPLNVTPTLDHTSLSASGTVNLTLTTASISLDQTAVPVTLTATSTDPSGAPIVQTATVLLTITGWAGHVHTLAGGPGGVGYEDGSGTVDEAEPTALVTDGGLNVYFADKRGTALRGLGLESGAVTTLVGGPYNYTIGDGEGAAYDPASQTVYIADALRNRIVAFTLGGYSLRVVAGSDAAGYADGVGAAASFDWPHGLALSPDHTTLYVADTDNEVVRAINVATGAVTTLAGQHGVYRSEDGVGAAAGFCQPTGLGLDPAGANLYISDACGYVIRKIAVASATVSTVAGTGAIGTADGPASSATFANLNGLAVDPHPSAPALYLTDGNTIRMLTLGSSPVVFTIAGGPAAGQSDGSSAQASFYSPLSLAALADNIGPNTTSLFLADADNGLIRRMDISNPLTASNSANVVLNVTTIAGQPSHRGNSDGVGTGADFSGASVAQFSQPEGIVTDGKIAYVADSINGAIRKIDLGSSTVTTVAGPHQGYSDGAASSAAFYQNAGLAWVPSLNLIYIADTGNGAIRKLDLGSSTVSTIAGTNASGYQDGSLTAARFNHPFGILASPDGSKLYVADTGNNAIRLIDLNAGTVSTIAGNGGLGKADGIGTAAQFSEPNGLAFDSTGTKIYISDFENQAIRMLDLTTGAVTTLVGSAHQCGFADGPASSASLCDPAFITTDGRSLFWGDSNTGLLRVLNLTTLQVSTLAGSPGVMHMADGDFTEAPGELTGPVLYNGVFGLAVSPDDSFILFTDKTANVIRIIN